MQRTQVDLPAGLRVRRWLLDGQTEPAASHAGPHPHPTRHATQSWWRVMCLTGVDYFSTLGYQPGIAVLAAGVLSPVATVVLVLVTLFGALPVYRRVAAVSPHGEGSIALLERILSLWKGKLFVLTLLGFAATDFMITMTLSAADATAHLDENPYWPAALRGHRLALTLVFLALLGAVFLKGFREAVTIAVALVGVYLVLNAVVVADGIWHVVTHPHVVSAWQHAVVAAHGSPLAVVAVALLVFPKLALGLSGFETGVAVMPLVRGDPSDTEAEPHGRIRGTRRLLTTAAAIMSVFLIASSIVTTLLIPERDFQPGGPANGRALAFLAHDYLGTAFGTVYDASTIAILWFAGASAMAGLLNLVPRYLPRYGMAPEWARAVRPLTLVFTVVAFGITWLFDANVDAQGGAYATGVLVVMTSAAVAAVLVVHRQKRVRATVAFGAVSLVFAYTTGANIVERPEGVKIGACFIGAIVAVSLVSRARRSFQTSVHVVELDHTAQMFVHELATRRVRLVANRPRTTELDAYHAKVHETIRKHDFSDQDLILVEVTVTDPSDFMAELHVTGRVMHDRYRVLAMEAPSIPAALAALLLHIERVTHRPPHIYFDWTEGNPASHLLRYLLFGEGEVAPVTREILREAQPDPARRPQVHVA